MSTKQTIASTVEAVEKREPSFTAGGMPKLLRIAKVLACVGHSFLLIAKYYNNGSVTITWARTGWLTRRFWNTQNPKSRASYRLTT